MEGKEGRDPAISECGWSGEGLCSCAKGKGKTGQVLEEKAERWAFHSQQFRLMRKGRGKGRKTTHEGEKGRDGSFQEYQKRKRTHFVSPIPKKGRGRAVSKC